MEKKADRFKIVGAACVLGLGVALAGCSSGGDDAVATLTNTDGETLSSVTSGLSLPSEISAVPTSSTAASSLSSALRQLASATTDLAATSDYAEAKGSKYIHEPVLDRFEIIEEVLAAINQTNYADASNINNGPYKSMVSMEDKQDGVDIKSLEPWIVDSRMIVEDGVDVNRVLCWIEETENTPEGPETQLIKAEMKVYQAATIAANGEILDYGKWALNVKFDEAGDNFFVATCEPSADGGSTIKVNEFEQWGDEEHTMQGVLYRAGATGYGKMLFTDWESVDWSECGQDCVPTNSTALYAYNADYLGVQKNTDDAIYKDRNTTYEMTHRYGLFYDENPPAGVTAGDDVKKHTQFGFPLVYTDEAGGKYYAYYGAWQGRHQLWGGPEGETIPAGTTVTKETWGSETEAVSYTVAPAMNGSFTKRTYVDAALADIQNVPVETWLDKHLDLTYASGWKQCINSWYDNSNGNCYYFDGSLKGAAETYDPAANAADLTVAEGDRKWVNINSWDGSSNTEYVYLAAADGIVNFTTAGFYAATWGMEGMEPVANADVMVPVDTDQMHISMGGSIYIAYTGTGTTGWVQKELLDFDERNWQPVFGDNDTEFNPDMGREYYMNTNGVNYVVKRKDDSGTAANDYDVLLEVQGTANPANCTATDCTDILQECDFDDTLDYGC